MGCSKMKNSLLVLLSILCVGCSAKQEDEVIIGTFMLQAESGYIARDNDQDAEVYIIDTYTNEVYVDGKGKKFTKEERERFEEMTPEERQEFIGPEETEGPAYTIKSLETTKEAIILEYADELIEFTALSDSYYEAASGVRYQFHEKASVLDYEKSLRGE